MADSARVITVCGSMKFKEEFFKTKKELTLEGKVVLLPVMNDIISGSSESESIKQMLGEIHKRKIDLADEIFVINKNGYIGSSTKAEIQYAKAHGKKVRFFQEG